MTSEELRSIVRGIAPAIREQIATAMNGLVDRVQALESRAQIPGPPGDKGATGLNGLNGQPGERGPEGPAGKDGSTIRVGIGAPTCEGRSGDVYLDTSTGHIYQWS